MAGMRIFGSLAAVAPLLLASLGAAPPDSLAALGGHWTCTVAGAPPAERSYFVVTAKLGPNAGRREIFGRQDATVSDGRPIASFERIVENAGGTASLESADGTGTAAAGSLRFAGRSFDDKTAMELVYAVNGDMLRRTVTYGAARAADETCAREAETPAPACATPNVPATTLHAVEPDYPEEAYIAKAKGVVEVRLVLDDRSRVLWSDVLRSLSPLLTQSAVRAARDSAFRTAVVGCRPVPAEYIFTVDYEP